MGSLDEPMNGRKMGTREAFDERRGVRRETIISTVLN